MEIIQNKLSRNVDGMELFIIIMLSKKMLYATFSHNRNEIYEAQSSTAQ